MKRKEKGTSWIADTRLITLDPICSRYELQPFSRGKDSRI